MWEQSGRDDKPVRPLRYFIKNTARKMRRLASLLGCREAEIATSSSSEEREIPEDELILSQGILPKRTSKQAARSAYQLKPRGKGPNRYTPEDYVSRGKKVVTEEDEGPRRRSDMSRMRNDEPFSSEEEEEDEEEQEQQEQQQEQGFAIRPPHHGPRCGHPSGPTVSPTQGRARSGADPSFWSPKTRLAGTASGRTTARTCLKCTPSFAHSRATHRTAHSSRETPAQAQPRCSDRREAAGELGVRR
ncbi:uncharacterized protein [Lolium perenne]|uniref:uncharacterized protein n=1 Tax=Lolium perenne TaxID=4522 RepID=UPI003A994ABA